MKLNKKIVSVLLTVFLLLAAALPALAVVSPGIDISQPASLNVRIMETGSNPPAGVPGGKVEIYQLTSVYLDTYSGYYHRVSSVYDTVLSWTEANELLEMTAETKDALVARILDYIKKNNVLSDAQAVPDAEGTASFTDLQLGLYLVVQTTAASRHTAIAPFLITLPQYNEDLSEVIYSVDAAPKVGTSDVIHTPPPGPGPDPTPKPTPDPEPTPGITPDPTTTPTPEQGEKLPQTGQLWWPVFVMVVLGLGFCAYGITLKRRMNHE